jgi:pyroglutamyl-peptidase
MKKKILITGFEAFDNDSTNPSAEWVKWMEGKMPERVDLRGEILPVTFGSAFLKFKKIYDEFKPDFVILTGLAKNRTHLTVERIGINWVDARIPDNDGVTIKSQKINHEGPDGLFTTIDVEHILTLARKSGLEMKVSTSAGEYVCNDILYKTLCYLQNKNTKATFIHLPGAENYDGIYLALLSIVNGL